MTQTQIRVPYSYLMEQFQCHWDYDTGTIGSNERTEDILSDLYNLIETGDYTLGEPVRRFEEAFAEKLRVKHAVGVSNGTDALFLAMKALGVGPGDEVVTVPNSFLATAGAIVQAGATVRFVDVGNDYLMTRLVAFPLMRSRLRAYLPVDLTGNISVPDMLPHPTYHIIHDAAQAVGAKYKGQSVASMGAAACFSLHPLKNINVWGDGGVVTTNDDALAEELRLLRNHGLKDRDTCVMPGYNHRLSSLQAIVAYHVLQDLDWITERRIANAQRYDEGLKDCPGIILPPRDPDVKQVYHTYVVQAEDRDGLIKHLADRSIEAKVHYPQCIHEQPGYAFLGYKEGDFPVAEAQAKRIVSLPIHQYLTDDQIDYTIEAVRDFYRSA